MKKLLYIILLAAVTSVSITACTDETVKPKTDTGNGNPSDPIK